MDICTNCGQEFERQHDMDAWLCDDCYFGVIEARCVQCTRVVTDWCSLKTGIVCQGCAEPAQWGSGFHTEET